MKRFLIAAMLVIGSLGATVENVSAQSTVACKPSASSYYTIKGAFPIYTGATRTLTNTAVDSIKFDLPGTCKPVSVTFTNDHYKVSGTPGGTVRLLGSANGGVTYDTVAIYSYVVSASSTTISQPKTYTINTGLGFPYTNLMWVWTGVSSMVGAWKSTVLVK